MSAKYVGVIGSGGNIDPGVLAAAEKVGELLAQHSAILVCGGRGGVMEAACRGAKHAGGMTLGILPGLDREEANSYVDVAIPTGLGLALRNFITVRACDSLIMLHGEVGTLSEVIIAYQHGKPVIAIETSGGWAGRLREAAYEGGAFLDGRRLMEILYVETPEQAVEKAIQAAGQGRLPERV